MSVQINSIRTPIYISVLYVISVSVCKYQRQVNRISGYQSSPCQRDGSVDHKVFTMLAAHDFDGLVPDCSNSSALAMELLQYCIKPSICCVCTKAETRWSPLCRRQWKLIFLHEECCISFLSFIATYCHELSSQQPGFGSGNASVPKRKKCDKSLSESMITEFADGYIRHPAYELVPNWRNTHEKMR